MKKKILFLVLAFVAGFSFIINNVKADGTPDLANSLMFYKANLNADVVKDSRISNTFYKYVYDSAKGHSGIAYCMNVGFNNPPHGTTVSKVSDITDPRLLYIMIHGYSAINGVISKGDLSDLSDHQAYYVTQLAIWMYKGQGNGGYAWSQFSQNNAFVIRAKQLYDASAAATDSSYSTPSIENAVASFELHYDASKKGYISDQMHVVGYVFSKYTINLSGAPSGTKLIRPNGQEIANGSTFDFNGNDDSIANGNYYIFVPESSVKPGSGKVTGITLTVSANTYVNRVFLYQSATPNLQPLGVLVPVNSTISTVQQYSFSPVEETKTCEQLIAELKKKYPNNRTKSNSAYMNDLNAYKKKDSKINTELGVENPRCTTPNCNEVLSYLKTKYPKSTTPTPVIDGGGKNYGYIPYYEGEEDYKEVVDAFLKKNYGLNVLAGYDNPKCEKPSCDEVLVYLKKKYPNCKTDDKTYINELKEYQKSYVIYTDDLCNPTCTPKKGPSCEEKRDELLKKYPNPGDRNKNNSLYIADLDAVIKVGQQYGWTFYPNDYTNPDCIPHAKRQVIIRKMACDSTGNNCNTDLAGATLTLKDGNGNIIAEWVSDGTPKVFTDLQPGNYSVYETNPPAGYNGTSKKDFVIPNDNSDYSIEIRLENTPLPPTGDINFTLIITAFVLFLGFGIFGLIKTSKREDM